MGVRGHNGRHVFYVEATNGLCAQVGEGHHFYLFNAIGNEHPRPAGDRKVHGPAP